MEWYGDNVEKLKEAIRRLDNKFLRGALQAKVKRFYEVNSKYLNLYNYKRVSSGLGFRIEVFYKKNYKSRLSELCDIYGSDKGEISQSNHPYSWPSHSYADYYSRLFSHCRGSVANVFECGLGTNNPMIPSSMGINGKPGASLRVWRDYFPNALVIGADIDSDVLFQEERIQTYFVDQLDPVSIEEMWRAVNVEFFDLMIDDGLHNFEAGTTLFVNSIQKLSPHGIYVIEDVHPSQLIEYRKFFGESSYDVEYVCLHSPDLSLSDNNLVLVRKAE